MAKPDIQHAKRTHNKIRTNNPRILFFLLFVVLFAFVGGFMYLATRAAGVATLSITPASSTVALGSTFTITITENSGSLDANAVNAVQADLTYDSTKFRCTAASIDMSTSAFSQFTTQKICENGSVKIAGARSSGVKDSQVVAKVTFEAIQTTTTTTPITFGSTSEVIKAFDASNILGTATGGNYTIADLTPPNIPTGVFKQASTASTITLSWTAPTDNVKVTGYKIFRGGTQVGTSPTNSYVDVGPLSPGSSYSYTVSAYDAAGNTSGLSTAFVCSPIDTTAPSTPLGLNLTSATTGSITFGWTASTDNVGVTGYKIFRGGTQVGTSPTNNFTNNTNMYVGTGYSYTVSAYDAAGNQSNQSATATFQTAYLGGDTDNNGKVDNVDLLAISSNYGISTGGTRAKGDFNNDGKVSISDLAIFAVNWATNLYP